MDRRRLSGELQRADREPDRMAAEGGGTFAARGLGNRPGTKRHRAQRELALQLALGRKSAHPAGGRFAFSLPGLLKVLLFAAIVAAAAPAFSAEKIVSSRVWPAQEYTRVTLEAAHPVRHQYFFVDNPSRLVVDLEGVALDAELKALPGKVGANDPYIQSVRVGINRPNVVRVVFDLRTEVKPSVFPLAPVGEYKHRLVLDIYPAHPADPLLALLQRPDPIGEIARTPTLDASTTAPPTPNDATAASLPVVKLEAAKTLALPS